MLTLQYDDSPRNRGQLVLKFFFNTNAHFLILTLQCGASPQKSLYVVSLNRLVW
jgi:hypothetical protein